MVMHFQIQLTRGPQRYLSCYQGGTNSILIRSHPIPWFIIHSKTIFITTQLQRSIWQSQSTQLHIVRNIDDLRPKDLAGVPLEINSWHIKITIPVVSWDGSIQHHVPNMHYRKQDNLRRISQCQRKKAWKKSRWKIKSWRKQSSFL
jgi:hypothetical protein